MDDEWAKRAKGLLRAEMTKRGISYKGLAERLSAMGVDENEANLRNKVSRGGFSAAFFIQALEAVGCQTLRLNDN